ncbi:MAG: hypothetical protein ACI9ND_002263, partial [Yoonia sp.]
PSFRRRLQNAKTGFRRYDLENGRVGSISKMSGKRDEVHVAIIDMTGCGRTPSL